MPLMGCGFGCVGDWWLALGGEFSDEIANCKQPLKPFSRMRRGLVVVAARRKTRCGSQFGNEGVSVGGSLFI